MQKAGNGRGTDGERGAPPRHVLPPFLKCYEHTKLKARHRSGNEVAPPKVPPRYHTSCVFCDKRCLDMQLWTVGAWYVGVCGICVDKDLDVRAILTIKGVVFETKEGDGPWQRRSVG